MKILLFKLALYFKSKPQSLGIMDKRFGLFCIELFLIKILIKYSERLFLVHYFKFLYKLTFLDKLVQINYRYFNPALNKSSYKNDC